MPSGGTVDGQRPKRVMVAMGVALAFPDEEDRGQLEGSTHRRSVRHRHHHPGLTSLPYLSGGLGWSCF